MNAVIYARFSSDKQTEDSIEAQVRACREYAARHNMNVVDTYTDEAISGKGTKTQARKQYQRLLRDCERSKFDTILIHKYDRIARNLGEHVNLEAKLKSKGIQLIATAQDFGQSNEAKIMRALIWSMSEYYVDNLANETRKGLQETALKAHHTGGYPPFGYDVVSQEYVINDVEAAFVRKIFDAAQSGTGFGQVIKEMAAAGVTGKRGKEIKYPQIYEMLRNEKYTGVYLYSPTQEKNRSDRRKKVSAIRIENAIPAIISKEQFAEVNKIMDEREHNGRRTYLCSGLVYCQCDAKMYAHTPRRKGHTYHYYICSKKCGAPVVHEDDVNSAAKKYLRDLLSEENQKIIATALRKYQTGEGSRMEEFRQVLSMKIAEKQREYDSLMKNLSSGALPEEVITDVGKRMASLKEEIETLKNTEPPKDFTVDIICSWLETLKKSADAEAIRLLIDRIDVETDENKKTVFNISSTLNTVVGLHGCGGAHHILPTILFLYCAGI